MCCYFDEIIKIEDNVDGFIRGYGGTKNIERCNSIFNRNRCLIRLKSGISHIVSHNYLKVKIDSDYDLSLEKTLTMLLSHIY